MEEKDFDEDQWPQIASSHTGLLYLDTVRIMPGQDWSVGLARHLKLCKATLTRCRCAQYHAVDLADQSLGQVDDDTIYLLSKSLYHRLSSRAGIYHSILIKYTKLQLSMEQQLTWGIDGKIVAGQTTQYMLHIWHCMNDRHLSYFRVHLVCIAASAALDLHGPDTLLDQQSCI